MAKQIIRVFPILPENDTGKFWSHIEKRGPEDCWLWTGPKVKGYGVFYMGHCRFYAHRTAYFLTHGIDPGDLLVCHKCDVKNCCNPAHLFLGTSADNVQDAIAKGRMAFGDDHPNRKHPENVARGERHYKSKLTEAAVVEIRRLHATGEWIQQKIAEKFGVSRRCIGCVLKRERWRHVA